MNHFQYKMTVIVPSYNNGQYIRQALDSILMQKVTFDYQIIITDDCSQDDSQNIIREYELKYSNKILALYSISSTLYFILPTMSPEEIGAVKFSFKFISGII